jgi:hypothetical protein
MEKVPFAMEVAFSEIEKCLDAGLTYAALVVCLTIPNLRKALEGVDPVRLWAA